MKEKIVRKARVKDVKEIHGLLKPFAERGEVLPRPLSEIYDNVRDYTVCCDGEGGRIIGACAIHVCWEDLAEIRSLVVAEGFADMGIGKMLVESCLAEARELGIHRVFVLTYKASFFERFGFHTIDKASLPHKIWADCLRCAKFPDCNEVAMATEP